jgi:hypothetical protein
VIVSWLTTICVGASFAALVGPVAADTGHAEALVAADRASAAGLSAVSRTYSATGVDYDRDGDQDVWIGYHASGGKLWSNRGDGTYRRVARSAWPTFNAHGKRIDRHDCAWADVDRNGRPDAYCSTGRFVANHVKRGRDNELWLGSRRGFREVGTAWGVGDVCGRGRQVTFLRANGDRYPDLFVGNDTPRNDPSDPCNSPRNGLPDEWSKLFLNTHGIGFRHSQRFWDFGAGPGGRCAEVIDVDGDGWDDLLTCGERRERPRLYHNQGGHGFADVTSAHELTLRVSDAVVADLDRDGDPDVVTATVDGFAYHLNAEGHLGVGQRIGPPLSTGHGRSVAVGDVDHDGDADVYGMVGDGRRSNPDDIVWLNEQLSFTPLGVPGVDGAADEVADLHPLPGGRAEFLVLNGFARSAGPIQLIGATDN